MKKIVSFFLLLLCTTLAIAQSIPITGRVVDENNQPINGASVLIKGTTTGTAADSRGNFKISASVGDVLVISAVGIPSTDVRVTSGNDITIRMAREGQTLSEVVVTALGVSTKKDKLAVSQSTVRGTDVARSGETNVITGMSSKASGVYVARSGGDPGAGANIQIRGQSTITGNLQPLFVIDGIPVSNSTLGQSTDGVVQQSRLNDLNPNDVESMEILKGAAAAALYGTRAANGVILIATKKGKAGNKINITYSATYSKDVLNKSVPLQTTYGQGSQGIFLSGANSNNRSWGDRIADRKGGTDQFLTTAGYVILPNGNTRYRVVSGTAANPHGGKNSKDVYDHSKELFQNGGFWDHNIAFSGGDEKGVFYASISSLQQNGILVAGSDYNRKTFRLNADRKFGMVKLGGTFNFVNTNSQRAQQGSNISGIFLGGLRTSPDYDNTFFEGIYVNPAGAQFPNRQISYRNPIGARTNSGYDNPFWILNRIKNTSEVNRYNGSFEATITPLSWLSIVERAGVDNYADERLEYFPTISASRPGGELTMQTTTETQFNNDFFARGNFNLNTKITLTALAGLNYNHRNFSNVGATARNFINEDVLNPRYDFGNSSADARFPFNSQSKIRTAASFAQLSFGLYDQLFVDLTGRNEVASTFNNTFFYPSASLAWQFTKLKVLQESKVLSFGKLRFSYGEVGVQPSPYLLNTYYNPLVVAESYGPTLDASSSTYSSGGYGLSSVKGNPDLKPERKKEFEAGLDLRFANNRISFSATHYRNKTVDAIFSVQVPASSGFTNTNGNAATIENRGYEGDLSFNWLKNKNWSVTTSMVASTNKNKVISLNGTKSLFLAGFTGISSRAVEGEALGTIWGVDFLKDDKGGLLLDANGFPQNGPQETVLADPNPDWIGGITNTVRWKNVTLSFLFDHVQGGAVWNGTKGALYTFGSHAETGNTVVSSTDLKAYNGATILANTPFRGAIANFGAGNVALNQSWYTDLGGGFGPVGAQFIEDGTRTRLREVSLGYSINGDKFRAKTRLQSIDISFTGRNLALWTKYTGIDPETNLTGPSNGRGIDYFNNPSTRSYLLTIRVNY